VAHDVRTTWNAKQLRSVTHWHPTEREGQVNDEAESSVHPGNHSRRKPAGIPARRDPTDTREMETRNWNLEGQEDQTGWKAGPTRNRDRLESRSHTDKPVPQKSGSHKTGVGSAVRTNPAAQGLQLATASHRGDPQPPKTGWKAGPTKTSRSHKDQPVPQRPAGPTWQSRSHSGGPKTPERPKGARTETDRCTASSRGGARGVDVAGRR